MRIVVYGTLRRNQGNSHWMTHAQWLGNYQLEGFRLYNFGHYPGVVPGDGKVLCEVYRIDAVTLGELDELRTKGGEYKRQLVKTPYGTAWLYIYQRSVNEQHYIPDGDWLNR